MTKLKKIIGFFIPTPQWQLVALLILGVFVGIAALLFHVSNASSYLSKDPKACINCHVMIPQFAAWERSSHARVASCVDCHVPHDNIFRTYFFKLKDGTRHATIFTMRTEPQVIRIHSEGAAVVQENCLHCHQSLLSDTSIHQATYEDYEAGDAKLCWECHREVPHGRVRSLSATPYTHTPRMNETIPSWIKNLIPNQENNNE